ncbi:hypothetical protein BOTBODRAFT_422504 [Botryobasidium botryosum FD-172 SS1]|uniref:Uncharacterized protein n=1 Tax=Botryobasidium botryosum (strain FD-172 SS1) TaxID=930990 RepID=A0A067M9E1_BOTB1|nr:hypothetical protein BOTBODRAFT_422504 [Botryobasidium botryosum FD-172 SS1]
MTPTMRPSQLQQDHSSPAATPSSTSLSSHHRSFKHPLIAKVSTSGAHKAPTRSDIITIDLTAGDDEPASSQFKRKEKRRANLSPPPHK